MKTNNSRTKASPVKDEKKAQPARKGSKSTEAPKKGSAKADGKSPKSKSSFVLIPIDKHVEEEKKEVVVDRTKLPQNYTGEQPKKPNNPYFIYNIQKGAEMRAKAKKDSEPNPTMSEIASVVKEGWAKMTDKQKAKYEKLAV